MTAWQEPVYLRGATSDRVVVNPGDFILGDEDGVIVIPRARIKEVLDIKSARNAENWNRFQRIEDVMDQESFIHLRTHIWKSLREEKPEDRH